MSYELRILKFCKYMHQGIQDIEKRTYNFAIDVIKVVNELPQKTAIFILGKQVIRSSTGINSNIVHAQNSLSTKESKYYLNNEKKEAKETRNWLLMLVDSGLLEIKRLENILDENEQIIKILVSSVKTLDEKENNKSIRS